MTDIHLVHSLFKTIQTAGSGIPADVTGLVVVSASGNQVQFAPVSELTGVARDTWSYAVLEVTTGVAKGLRTVVVASDGVVITLASTMGHDYPISVGDIVTLSGGPLKAARIYMFEPASIKKALDDGKKFLVTINSLDGRVEFKGMGGNSTKGMSAAMFEYSLEVVAETPNISGLPTEDDVRRVLFDLPALKDQLLVICHYFKLKEGSRIYGVGPIEFTYAMIQRTGSTDERRACILQFDINSI